MLEIDKVTEHCTLCFNSSLVRPFQFVYMHIFASLTDCYHVKHRRNDTLHTDVYKFVTQPKWLNVYNVVCGRKISNPQCQRGKRRRPLWSRKSPKYKLSPKHNIYMRILSVFLVLNLNTSGGKYID